MYLNYCIFKVYAKCNSTSVSNRSGKKSVHPILSEYLHRYMLSKLVRNGTSSIEPFLYLEVCRRTGTRMIVLVKDHRHRDIYALSRKSWLCHLTWNPLRTWLHEIHSSFKRKKNHSTYESQVHSFIFIYNTTIYEIRWGHDFTKFIQAWRGRKWARFILL